MARLPKIALNWQIVHVKSKDNILMNKPGGVKGGPNLHRTMTADHVSNSEAGTENSRDPSKECPASNPRRFEATLKKGAL